MPLSIAERLARCLRELGARRCEEITGLHRVTLYAGALDMPQQAATVFVITSRLPELEAELRRNAA